MSSFSVVHVNTNATKNIAQKANDNNYQVTFSLLKSCDFQKSISQCWCDQLKSRLLKLNCSGKCRGISKKDMTLYLSNKTLIKNQLCVFVNNITCSVVFKFWENKQLIVVKQ